MHNPTAGDEEHSPEQLTAVLQEAGHEVLYQSVKEDGWPDALGARAELVVVAGGDGTVDKVFKELVGRDLPVALLPLGSANNVARTLGLAGDASMRLAAAWKGGRIRPYDIGEVESTWGCGCFVECVGGGIFGEVLARAGGQAKELSAEEKNELGFELLETVIYDATEQHWALELDGSDLTGEFLAVEVMNIREIGPNVPLAPAASPGDGLLDLVLVRPDHREGLAAYIRASARDGPAPPPPLTRIRGRRLTMRFSSECRLHVDDELWPERRPGGAGGEAVVSVDRRRVDVIHPHGGPRR